MMKLPLSAATWFGLLVFAGSAMAMEGPPPTESDVFSGHGSYENLDGAMAYQWPAVPVSSLLTRRDMGSLINDEDRRDRPRYRLEGSGSSLRLWDGDQWQAYTGVEIYDQLGEEELAQEYRSRVSRKRTVGWSAAGVVAAGVATGVAGALIGRSDRQSAIDGAPRLNDDDPSLAACDDYEHEPVRQNCRARAYEQHHQQHGTVTVSHRGAYIGLAGAAIAVVGGVTYLISRRATLHPISRNELESRVQEANGISDDEESTPESEDEDSLRVDAAPFFLPGADAQAGLRLQIRW